MTTPVALLDVEELRARAFMNPVPHDGILMRLAAEEIARLGKAISETHAALDHLLHGATTVLMHIQPDEDHCEIVYLPGNELDALKYGIEQAEAVLGRNPHSSLPTTER